MAKAEIKINGREYSIACAPGQESNIVQLSVELDQRVNDIRGAVGDVGEERLLLVAALAMLDELRAAKRAGPAPHDVEQRVANVISETAMRIDALAARVESGQ